MKLLNFNLPTTARLQFVSLKAKEYWEPKIAMAKSVGTKLELLSVVHGLRDCKTVHILRKDFDEQSRFYQETYGMFLVKIISIAHFNGFSEIHRPPRNKEEEVFFCAVSKNKEIGEAFKQAYLEHNHEKMGIILGYPLCCSKIHAHEMENGYFDPIFQQAEKVDKKYIKNQEETLIRLSNKTPWEINSFLTVIGIRIIPHTPCSHDCIHSVEIARKWLNLAEELKLEGLEDLKLILQFSCEWDAYKGIGYITTPIFKIEKNTVTCYPNYIVQKEGKKFPLFSGKGLKFPFITF
jgi:hypothetical protein